VRSISCEIVGYTRLTHWLHCFSRKSNRSWRRKAPLAQCQGQIFKKSAAGLFSDFKPRMHNAQYPVICRPICTSFELPVAGAVKSNFLIPITWRFHRMGWIGISSGSDKVDLPSSVDQTIQDRWSSLQHLHYPEKWLPILMWNWAVFGAGLSTTSDRSTTSTTWFRCHCA